MGYSITPTFRLEIIATGGYYTPSAWDTKHAGRPTDENLAADIAHFEASTREGGCNAHLGNVTVFSAQVVRQSTDKVVATYTGPAFAVVAGHLANDRQPVAV